MHSCSEVNQWPMFLHLVLLSREVLVGVTLKTHMSLHIDVALVLIAQEISSIEGGEKRLTGDGRPIKVGLSPLQLVK